MQLRRFSAGQTLAHLLRLGGTPIRGAKRHLPDDHPISSSGLEPIEGSHQRGHAKDPLQRGELPMWDGRWRAAEVRFRVLECGGANETRELSLTLGMREGEEGKLQVQPHALEARWSLASRLS